MTVRIVSSCGATELSKEESKKFLDKFCNVVPTETEKMNNCIDFSVWDLIKMVEELPEDLKYDPYAEMYKGAK